MSGPIFGNGWFANLIGLFIMLIVWIKNHWFETLMIALILAGLVLLSGHVHSQQMPQRSAQSAIPKVGVQKTASPELSPQRQMFAAYRLGMKEYQAPAQPHGLMFPESTKWWLLGFVVVVVGLLVLVIGLSSGWW